MAIILLKSAYVALYVRDRMNNRLFVSPLHRDKIATNVYVRASFAE